MGPSIGRNLGGWRILEEVDRYVHVLPVKDLRDHEVSRACWCLPKAEQDDPNVIVHNAMDEREFYERGERKIQ